ncbi:hypothetical protein Tco_1026041 [Tanacetum coccineum]
MRDNDYPQKPVTTHYSHREKESAFAKPHLMIAPSSSRYSSNDMVHNHYLEEAKKQTHEIGRNSKTSVMPSARSQSTTNGSKPKPRINNQNSRNWPASKRKIFKSSTTKVDIEPPHGYNTDITNLQECIQTLDLSTVFILINGEPWLYNGGGIPFQLKSNSLPHAHAQTTKTYYKHQDSRIMKAQELKTKTSVNSDIQDLPLRYQVYRGRLLASFQDDATHVGQDTRSQGGKDNKTNKEKI